MKNKILSFVTMLMIALSLGNFGSTVEAAGRFISVNLNGEVNNYETVNLEVDGNIIEGDMSAILYNSSTMVPIKFIADAIGAETEWKNGLRETTIKKSDTIIKVKMGETVANVNGVEKNITGGVAPVIGNDRTLVPIRFVAEELGFEVGWNNDTRSALLNSKTAPADQYEVYQEGIKLSSFQSLNLAIAESQKWQNSTVKYQDDVVWSYSDNNTYSVYQDNTLLGSFETETSAILEAKKWAGSVVKLKEEIIWDFNKDNVKNKKLIVIDPGHGGSATGAISSSRTLLEKNLNLNVSLKLNDELKARGYETIMTRTTDTLVGPNDSTAGLTERANIANRVDADAFISVHFNSAGAASASGIETYYYEKGGSDKYLAQCIQNRLIEATGAVNRGVKTNSFVVIKKTKTTAALLELGFISNPKDEARLGSDNYHSLVAKAAAQGIDDYFQ